jgi:plastocyanin
MATLATPPVEPTTIDTPARTGSEWRRLLVWTTGVVAAVDLAFMALAQAVIPPLAIGVVLTAIGIALHRRFPRSAVIVLGSTSVLLLAGGLQFAVGHLAHPASGIDFVHAVVGIFGRVVAIGVSVAALRRTPASGARRVGAASVVGLAASLLVAGIATAAATGEEAEPGDVVTAITEHDFDDVETSSGDTLFVDNQTPFRHTYTVEGTSLDVDLPAGQGARAVVDLPPGSYDVICAVPGHEAMSGTLAVR